MLFLEKNDKQIQKDVANEIQWDPRITSTNVNVTAKNGVVTLRGDVPHYFEKSAAEEAAQRVAGVRAIADEIDVKMMGSYERTDEDIAQAALNALEWNVSVPQGVKVVVDKGWVSLSGEVTWDYQRAAAKKAVATLMGVSGVHNTISIKHHPLKSEVKARIEDALKRSAQNDVQKISVAVSGDRVTLTGKVHSVNEIADAGLAAWNAPGVTTLINNLRVEN